LERAARVRGLGSPPVACIYSGAWGQNQSSSRAFAPHHTAAQLLCIHLAFCSSPSTAQVVGEESSEICTAISSPNVLQVGQGSNTVFNPVDAPRRRAGLTKPTLRLRCALAGLGSAPAAAPKPAQPTSSIALARPTHSSRVLSVSVAARAVPRRGARIRRTSRGTTMRSCRMGVCMH